MIMPMTNFDWVVCVLHTVQSALESGQEARIVHIDFIDLIDLIDFIHIDFAAFDRVNLQGIRYKHCSKGIGGSVLSILTLFL